MTYEQQLLTIEWIRLKFEILYRDHYQCSICRTSYNLNVHHKYYIFGRMAWEYDGSILITLCEKHHKLDHDCLLILNDYHIKEHLDSGMLAYDIIMKIKNNEPINF